MSTALAATSSTPTTDTCANFTWQSVVVDQTVAWNWRCVLTEKFLISAGLCLLVIGVGTDQGLSFLTRKATNEQVGWQWRIFFAAIAVAVIIVRRKLKARRLAKAAAAKKAEKLSAYLSIMGLSSMPEDDEARKELDTQFEQWLAESYAAEEAENAIPVDTEVDYPPQEGEEDIEMVERSQVPQPTPANSLGEALLGALVREILKDGH